MKINFIILLNVLGDDVACSTPLKQGPEGTQV